MSRLLESDLTLTPSEPGRESLLVTGRAGVVLWVAGAAIAVGTIVALGGQPVARPTDAPAQASPVPAPPPPVTATLVEASAPVGEPAVAPTLVATAPEPVVRAPTSRPGAAGRPVRGGGLPPPNADETVPGVEDPEESPEQPEAALLPETEEVDAAEDIRDDDPPDEESDGAG